MLLMICFIGLRWTTGTDWSPYKLLFDTLELNWTFLFNVYHFDFGFVVFNSIVKLFTNNYSVLLFVNSLVTIVFLFLFIKKTSPFPNVSLFLFYSSFMLAQFMGSNRRMMAMVFVLWAIWFLYNNQKSKFYCLEGLAFLFHRSSIITFVLIFVPREILSIRKTIILLFLSFILGVFGVFSKLVDFIGLMLYQFIQHPVIEKMVFYSEYGEEHMVSSTGNLFLSTFLAVAKRCLFLFFYFYIIRKNVIDKFTQYVYNIYIYAFAGYLIFIGSFFQMLTAYFALIEIILLARMYSYTSGRVKLVFLLLILLYGFIQMLSALNVYPDLYMPYISIFSNIER